MSAEFSQQHQKMDRGKVPVDIIYHRISQILELVYADDTSVSLRAEYLRVLSPSAEVRGHTSEQAVLQYGKKLVNISGISLQGSYAILITFDDKHDTGVYTWNYLWDLAKNESVYWLEYLDKISRAGKTREK